MYETLKISYSHTDARGHWCVINMKHRTAHVSGEGVDFQTAWSNLEEEVRTDFQQFLDEISEIRDNIVKDSTLETRNKEETS